MHYLPQSNRRGCRVGVCLESSTGESVPADTYQCKCAPGFANGVCSAGFVANYSEACTVSTGGHCNIDVDECASNPCQNEADCSDSSTNSDISFDAFSCACVAGYANGLCAFGAISLYLDRCQIAEGKPSHPFNTGLDIHCGTSYKLYGDPQWITTPCTSGGNLGVTQGSNRGLCVGARCDIDIDECSSFPCQNGAICTESGSNTLMNSTGNASNTTDMDAFSCVCHLGFTNGLCGYTSILPYTNLCAVQFGGRCDIDVDECSSSPCSHMAVCSDSTSDPSVGAGFYACSCRPGYQGSECQEDVDECISTPCVNNATCHDSVQTYWCQCERGWDGDECEVEVDPCDRHEDDCAVHSTCIKLIPGSHVCSCHRGYEKSNMSDPFGVCESINDCISSPCLNGALCGDLIDGYNCTSSVQYLSGPEMTAIYHNHDSQLSILIIII